MTIGKDELASALKSEWVPRLAPLGFKHTGRHRFVRETNGIAQTFYFKLSRYGTRMFRVIVSSIMVCGNEYSVITPGFYLARASDGGQLSLPSASRDEAMASVGLAWIAAAEQALPWLEANRTLTGLLQTLQSQNWASQHHRYFQIGIVEALLGRKEESIANLHKAIEHYADDGRGWCSGFITKAKELEAALYNDGATSLLARWYEANRRVHRIS